jgi:hypothetical protein
MFYEYPIPVFFKREIQIPISIHHGWTIPSHRSLIGLLEINRKPTA